MHWMCCLLYVLATFVAQAELKTCKNVKGIENLDMKQSLGTWYVIKRTRGDDVCVKYDISRHKLGRYKLRKFGVHTVPSRKVVTLQVELFTNDKSNRGVMGVKYPYDMGSGNVTILNTDYDNYGVMYFCKSMPHGETHSVAILSRKRKLSKNLLRKAQGELNKLGDELSRVESVSHAGCDDFERARSGYY